MARPQQEKCHPFSAPVNKVEVTHPDKILFPKAKITKQDLVNYYKRVARMMLPHVKDRPISMKKYPKGIKASGFFQKNVTENVPSYVKKTKVKLKEGSTEMVLCQNQASLLWLANQNCITPHIWLSKIQKPDYPDRMIFDLDPPSKKGFQRAIDAALALREILKKQKLTSFVMTTGSKGLHVVIPIKPTRTFDEVRSFAKEIAQVLVEENPKAYTTEQRKEKRLGRLYIDVLRNGRGQTAVAPYAVRPKPNAPIAMPLTWEELKEKGLQPDSYTLENCARRLSKNPWSSFFRSAKTLSQ